MSEVSDNPFNGVQWDDASAITGKIAADVLNDFSRDLLVEITDDGSGYFPDADQRHHEYRGVPCIAIRVDSDFWTSDSVIARPFPLRDVVKRMLSEQGATAWRNLPAIAGALEQMAAELRKAAK